jgi:hypothetical protein
MRTSFEAAHEGQLVGKLIAIDRLIIHGHLRRFSFNRGFQQFLLSQKVRVPALGALRFGQRN